MGYRVFQVASELDVDTKIILRKLVHEELPPPKNREGLQTPWKRTSSVSVGLKEMIREWHSTGKLLKVVETAVPKEQRKSRKAPPETTKAMGGGLDEAVARQALDAVTQIEFETKQKKRALLEGLKQSRDSILSQLKELTRQIEQINAALAVITGQAAPKKRGWRDLSEVRERMGQWLEARRGEKFGAGDLAEVFPELEGTAVSYVLKPLVEAGRLQTDMSQGSRRPKYFAPAAADG